MCWSSNIATNNVWISSIILIKCQNHTLINILIPLCSKHELVLPISLQSQDTHDNGATWSDLLTHICVTRGRWVHSLCPSDTMWWHKSGSTLAQVMACCLTAPSHYLNQCWLIISKVQWHSSECNFTRDASITKIRLKITYLKFHWNSPGANELMCWSSNIVTNNV